MSGDPVVRAKKRRKAKPSTDRDMSMRLASKIIRHRAKGICDAVDLFSGEMSACDGPIEAAHVVRRGRSATDSDLANLRGLCRRHHTYVDSNGAAMVYLIGREEYERLWQKGNRGVREFSGLTPTMWWRSERERLTEIAKAEGVI